MVNGRTTPVVAAERTLLGLDDAKPCLREIRRNYNLADGPALESLHFRILLAEQPLGLRWARIYKPDHMTTLFGLVGVAPFCAEFVLLAFRKASTCSPRFAVGTSQSEHLRLRKCAVGIS